MFSATPDPCFRSLLGYWIFYFGGDTNTFGGGWPGFTENWESKILLTENSEPNPDCTLLKKWEGKEGRRKEGRTGKKTSIFLQGALIPGATFH